MAQLEARRTEARAAMRVRRHLGFSDKPDDFNIETGESVMEFWQSATRGIYVVTIVVTAHLACSSGGVVVDEHHAGLGHRAHPRDRRAQGAGRRGATSCASSWWSRWCSPLFGGACGRAGRGRPGVPAGVPGLG